MNDTHLDSHQQESQQQSLNLGSTNESNSTFTTADYAFDNQAKYDPAWDREDFLNPIDD